MVFRLPPVKRTEFSVAEAGFVPGIVIDVAQIGGIYAGITQVSTEIGVCNRCDEGLLFSAFKPSAYALDVAITRDTAITVSADHQIPSGGAPASGTPNFATSSIPNTSLYHVIPASNSHVLIETDPRFANYRTWPSSD